MDDLERLRRLVTDPANASRLNAARLPAEESKRAFAALEAEKARMKGAPFPAPIFDIPEGVASDINVCTDDELHQSDSVLVRLLRRRIGLAKASCRLLIPGYGLTKARRALDHVRGLQLALAAALSERRRAEKESRDKADAAEQKRLSGRRRNGERVTVNALAAARENREPDVEGANDLAVVKVTDPTEAASFVKAGPGAPIEVSNKKAPPRDRVMSVRDDHFLFMIVHDHLKGGHGTEIRKRVGLKLRTLYGAAEVGNVRAVDPAFDRVEGGNSMPSMDRRIDAVNELERVDGVVGRPAAKLLRRVIEENESIIAIAQAQCPGAKPSALEKEKTYLSGLFRTSLDELAEEWGWVSKPGERRRAAGG